ncbi:MAG: TonB-dependent receptor [Gemmatimonadaceae bacterium]
MNDATTLKLLMGRAFRAPNEYELYFDNSVFGPNQNLRPESIETTEQRVDSSDGRLAFENAGEMRSNAAELGLTVNRGQGVTGQLSYSLQKSEDAVGTRLTRSPRQIAKLLLRSPLMGNAFIAGLDAQYGSALATIGGKESSAYTLTNVSLLVPRLSGRLALSATIYNLFGARYSNPGSDAHIQDVIQQDGRSCRVRTMVRFQDALACGGALFGALEYLDKPVTRDDLAKDRAEEQAAQEPRPPAERVAARRPCRACMLTPAPRDARILGHDLPVLFSAARFAEPASADFTPL